MSEAVKFPWDSGEGRVGRGVITEMPVADVEVFVVDVVAEDIDGDNADGREELVVAVDPEEEEEEFR